MYIYNFTKATHVRREKVYPFQRLKGGNMMSHKVIHFHTFNCVEFGEIT